MAACVQNPSDTKKLARLHGIASATPLYPDFKQIRVSESAKSNIAYVIISYNSIAAYNEVKQFYIQALTADGWEFSKETQSIFGEGHKALIFKKGEDSLSVTYRDGEYSLGYCWGCSL